MYNLIRKHKKPPRSMQSELLVNGDLITHPDDVQRTWADHFEMLATPQPDTAFDEKFKAEIDESASVIQLISKYMAEESIVISPQMKSQQQFPDLRGKKQLTSKT